MAATELLSRGRPDARRGRRPAVGAPLPLHGLRADRRRDRGCVEPGSRGAVNLAPVAARRVRAPPRARGVPRADVRRAARRACGGSPAASTSTRRPRRGRPRQPARDGAPLLGVPVGGRRRSSRSRGGSRTTSSTTASTTAARASSCATATSCPTGRSTRVRSTGRRARALADPLHLGHDRPAEGRPALAPRRPRRRLVAGAPARLPLGRPHPRRDAALPHDGDPLARRDAPRRRLLRPARALGCGRGARLIEGAADHVALPRADAVPRPRPPPRARRLGHLVRARARLRGRGDDVDPRRALRRRLRAGGVRQPLRLDRDLHVLDRPRPAGEAGLRGPAGREQRGCASSARAARSASTSPPTRRSPATGTDPTRTRRRSATAGTAPATPATSTRTATSGSTAGSTT